jgi:DNA-binding GntR family transcriptional regulator
VDSSKTTLTPFAENVVLSALYGRCLTHRRLAIATALNGKKVSAKDSSEFCRRHEWLAAAVERRIVPLADISLDPCDPIAIFGRSLGRSAIIYLSDTAATWPWDSSEHHLMVTASQQRAYQAATEIAQLACALPRLSYLKASRPKAPKVCQHKYTCMATNE